MSSGQLLGAHLVGSVPLADAESVFRAASRCLGPHLRRLPDGETGVRSDWIHWQYDVVHAHPALEPDPEVGTFVLPGNRPEEGTIHQHRVRPGSDPEQLRFGDLGYARAALGSWQHFERLQRQGEIPQELRFQVSLPTPLAPVFTFVSAPHTAAVEPAYEAAMLRELRRICDGIPHHKLAVQWDVCHEMIMLEGVFKPHFTDVEAGVVERLARLSAAVPGSVELGLHLCYGDPGHRHIVEPRDTARLVALASRVLPRLERAPSWLHLPVPRERSDDAYFEPLRGLELPATTALYLGLVHWTDGLAGAQRRLATARRFQPSFGIATECGFGRRPPATVLPLLELHAAVLAEASGSG